MTNNRAWTGTTKSAEGIHPDLEWLARNVSEWKNGYHMLAKRIDSDGCKFETLQNANYEQHHDYYGKRFDYSQWLQARKDLGLIMSDEEESMPAKEHRNKYMREIKPGVWVDVYDVLDAWDVRNAALQHLIKKALQPGGRGHKTMEQDMNDIVASALRARELGV